LLQFYAVGDWFNQRLQFKHCSLANFREFDLSRLFQIHFLQNGTTYLIDTFYFNLCTLTFLCVNLLVIGRRWTSNFCPRIISHWNWTQILLSCLSLSEVYEPLEFNHLRMNFDDVTREILTWDLSWWHEHEFLSENLFCLAIWGKRANIFKTNVNLEIKDKRQKVVH
jgi:hypothetical protein